MKFNITDEYGVAILRDKNVTSPIDTWNENKKALIQTARQGDVFYIDLEDPIQNLNIEILTENESEPNYLNWYDPEGGSFLLNNTSGKLVLTGLEDWINNQESVSIIELDLGYYAVEVFSQDIACLDRYSIEMSQNIGKEDWEYYNKTHSPCLAFAGCLPMLVAILAMLFVALKIGLYFIILAVILWLPFIIKLQSKRYKKVAKMVEDYNKCLPLYILRLTKIDSDKGLVGGFIR